MLNPRRALGAITATPASPANPIIFKDILIPSRVVIYIILTYVCFVYILERLEIVISWKLLMANTFYFYDLETSGFNPRAARIMQFAGQRTDMNLNPIGEPDNMLIKITPDILP